MMKKIKKFYKTFDVDTEKLYGSYKINKKVFRVSLFLIVFLVGIAFLTAPAMNMVYVDCPLGSVARTNDLKFVSGCDNPFFEQCKQETVPCNEPFLNAGSTYGEPFTIPFFHNCFIVWVLIILSFAILFNHLKYNRGRKY